MKTTLQILIVTATILIGTGANAQSWQWVNRMGSVYQESQTNEQIAGTGLDREGNIYVAGRVMAYASFGDSVVTTSYSTVGYQGFIAKYDCEGNLLWKQMCLSNQQDDNVSGLAVDSLGNCYITGTAEGTITHFGDTTFSVTNSGGDKWFIAKYDNGGSFQWVRFTANQNYAVLYDGPNIGINSQGFIIATGTTAFTGTIFPSINLHSGDFLVAFTSFGTAIWGYNIDTFAFNGGTIAMKYLTVDNNDNIYIVGWFADTVSIGTQILNVDPNVGLGNHSFVAKFSSGGIFQWAKQGHCADNADAFIGIQCYGNNAYIYGSSPKNDTLFDFLITYTGSQFDNGSVILKLDNTGNLISGINRDSIYIEDVENGYFTKDNNGNIGFTSGFGDILKWGNLSSIQSTSGSNNPYFMKMDTTLNILIIEKPNGVGGQYDGGEGITINQQGDIYVAGAFSEILYVGADTVNNSGGNNDLFLLKYGSTCTTTGINELPVVQNNKDINMTVFPNPNNGQFDVAINTYLQKMEGELIIFNSMGQEIMNYPVKILNNSLKLSINLPELSSGVYSVELKTEKEVVHKETVVVK